jgi:hypothetical protein
LAPVRATQKYTEKILWSFNNTFNKTDGYEPYGRLILDRAGDLYGTTYAGGSNSVGAVFELTGVVETTVTTLRSSPNPSIKGQAVTFTAVVVPSAGVVPDGEKVSFKMGTTVLGTGTLNGGSATFMTSTLRVGTTSVTAVYTGDSNFRGSTSTAVRQVVEK